MSCRRIGVILFLCFVQCYFSTVTINATPEIKTEIQLLPSENFNKTLTELKGKLKKIYYLNSVMALLMWDQHVVMPPQGSSIRSKQVEILDKIIHKHQTSKKLKTVLEILKEESKDIKLNIFDKKLIEMAEKNYKKKMLVNEEISKKITILRFKGFGSWRKAKQENNFNAIVPILKEWVELKKIIAKSINPNLDTYDVLIDEYDPGMTMKDYDSIFEEIKQFIIPFIKKHRNKESKNYLNQGEFDISKQKELNENVIKMLGFSFDHGRLDSSAHPITKIISNWDVRITTRYKKENFLQSLKFSMHESGHGIYEQNLPKQYFGLPVGDAHGMSLHESQSLLWERHIGLSKPFWKNIFKNVTSLFPHLSKDLNCEMAYKEVNVINPTFIRVESDEVTYPIHIIIRYEIEKGLFNGTYQVEDLPKIFNQKMKDYLGIEPDSDTNGVLQDIHWNFGAYGYFPSYLYGQMLAAQIFKTITKEIPNVNENIEKGEFLEIRNWLISKIHQKGSALSLDDLMIDVTGEKLNPKHFLNYLSNKYSDI
eukprot:gene249-4495_t